MTKSKTLNSKQYQNPNDRNRKKEKGFGHLNFGNWDLFTPLDMKLSHGVKDLYKCGNVEKWKGAVSGKE